jgi:uncharacterized membrane protein YdjX (TVP38/TMEM64 family)
MYLLGGIDPQILEASLRKAGIWDPLIYIFIYTIATISRTIGREWVAQKLAINWQAMDTELRYGGLFYMFAIRLVPIIPYGLEQINQSSKNSQ